MINKTLLGFILLLVPIVLSFRNLFLGGPAVWGDAPYFYTDGLQELLLYPQAWTYRSSNLGDINQIIFIWPITYLYGHLHLVFGWGNDILIRLVFYFPSLALSLFGIYYTTRYLRFPLLASLISSLIYTLNTYFLLLVDGGQVGVALGYGLFPIFIILAKRYIDKKGYKNFYLSLIPGFVLLSADARIGLIAFFTLFIWILIEDRHENIRKIIKNILSLFLLVSVLLLISSYWLLPILLNLKPQGFSGESPLQVTSFLHTLTLYQPHWPENEFGKVTYPSLAFLIFPIVTLLGLYVVKSRQYTCFFLLVLFFAFLAKGTTPPFGNLYHYFLSNIPLAEAFRDSTKFFIPLIFFYSLIFGYGLSDITSKVNIKFKYLVLSGVLAVVLLTSLPALFGSLNGVLSDRKYNDEFLQIQEITDKNEFSRTVWLPERHPFGDSSRYHQSVDGKNLINFHPFASLNTGTYDKFNFLNSKFSQELFRLLGVKYLVLSGDVRDTTKTSEEKEDWEKLTNLVFNLDYATKIKDGDFPVFEIDNSRSQFFVNNKLFVVIGGENIYSKIFERNSSFSLSKQAFIFIEDGKWNTELLQGVSSDSLIFIFNEKKREDLIFSYLQNHFISTFENNKTDWAMRSSSDYIKWRYELLVNGIETQEFDYNKGISFSTHSGEKIQFTTDIPSDGDYMLAVRTLSDNQDTLKVITDTSEASLSYDRKGSFSWLITELPQLKKGSYSITLENPGGVKVINVIALVPVDDYAKTELHVNQLLSQYGELNVDLDFQELDSHLANSESYDVPFTVNDNSSIKLDIPAHSWLVYTDKYSPMWKLGTDEASHSIPFYSMVNGFYIKDGGDQELIFKGQEYVDLGIKATAVFAVLLVSSFFVLLAQDLLKRNSK